MKPSAMLLAPAAALCLLAACSRRPAPVPRPVAYPRIEVYPEAYSPVQGLMLNDSARLEPGAAPGWFDIVYPAYGARVNCTLTRVKSSAELREVLSNRLERLERNAAGTAGSLTSLTSEGGVGVILMVTPQALMTPVQFLATDSVGAVLSGVAVFASPGSEPDSVAPAVGALERDLLFMLKNLQSL